MLGVDFYEACSKGDSDELLRLIHNHNHARIQSDTLKINKLNSLLRLACMNGHVECAKVLISEGANINESNEYGFTAIHYAAQGTKDGCYGMNSECLELLICSNADINKIDIDGNTPLHIAAYSDAVDCMKILIESGADVTIKNNKGKTFLECIRGKPVLKEELLSFLHAYEFPMKEPAE